MSPRAAAALLLASLALGGCHADWVREHPFGCRADEQARVRDTLYFGRSIPGGGRVDAAAWARFEAEVLLPAFPQGYTLVDAPGAVSVHSPVRGPWASPDTGGGIGPSFVYC